MRRFVEFEVPHDTSLFTPVQLQPRVLMTLAMSSWARWLKAHFISFPRMIRERKLGAVVVGTRAEHLRPHGFFDDDALQARCHLEGLGGGKLLGLDLRLFSRGTPVAQAYTLVRMVAIEDPEALAATPCDVPADFLALLFPEDIRPEAPARGIPLWSRRIRERGAPLGERSESLVLYRGACEVADQWSFIELPVLAAASREALFLSAHGELRAALGMAVWKTEVELRRPFYVFSEASLSTTAARVDSQLVLEHQLRSKQGELHATVVEVLVPPGQLPGAA